MNLWSFAAEHYIVFFFLCWMMFHSVERISKHWSRAAIAFFERNKNVVSEDEASYCCEEPEAEAEGEPEQPQPELLVSRGKLDA